MKTRRALIVTAEVLGMFLLVLALVVGGIKVTERMAPVEADAEPAAPVTAPASAASPEPVTAQAPAAFPTVPESMGTPVISSHPYIYYSDDVLRDLAASDPAAAVILGRRAQTADESLHWFERATILSGEPRPLIEWNQSHNEGGMAYDNGILDVDKAAKGYELLLVMQRIGYQSAARPLKHFRQALIEAGEPLAPIVARADARFARMTEERAALLGAADWSAPL